jgi:hypothetical protein
MLPPFSAPESTRTGLTTVCTVAWRVGCGRIYQTRGSPDNLRWFWSMTVNGPMTRSDRVATLGRHAKSAPTESRFSLQEFVRSHDLIRKSATFPAHALGAVLEELGCMEGGGQSWSNRADDLHNPRNRHALCVLVDVRPPRVASSLARAAEALDAQAPGPFRNHVCRQIGFGRMGGGCCASFVGSGPIRLDCIPPQIPAYNVPKTAPFPISLPL